MNQEEQLEIGSVQLQQACFVSGDPHERSSLTRRQIARGREYLDYVIANVRPGELDHYIDAQTLNACLDVEGWRRELNRTVLRVGTDRQVEVVVQRVASPGTWCGGAFTTHYEPKEAERLIAACERLGLREASP